MTAGRQITRRQWNKRDLKLWLANETGANHAEIHE